MKVDNLIKLLENNKWKQGWEEGVISHVIPPSIDNMWGGLIVSFNDGSQISVAYSLLKEDHSKIYFKKAKQNDQVLVKFERIKNDMPVVTEIKLYNKADFLPSEFHPLNKRIDLE